MDKYLSTQEVVGCFICCSNVLLHTHMNRTFESLQARRNLKPTIPWARSRKERKKSKAAIVSKAGTEFPVYFSKALYTDPKHAASRHVQACCARRLTWSCSSTTTSDLYGRVYSVNRRRFCLEYCTLHPLYTLGYRNTRRPTTLLYPALNFEHITFVSHVP